MIKLKPWKCHREDTQIANDDSTLIVVCPTYCLSIIRLSLNCSISLCRILDALILAALRYLVF